MATPKHTGGIDLEGAAELWVSPTAQDGNRWRQTATPWDTGVPLSQQVANQFPTPAARDWRSESGGGSDNDPLQQAIRTQPTGNDRALFPPGPADRDAWRDIIADRPDLAPAVEYEVRGMASRIAGGLDFARPDQLRSLGNMVVPQQGALALLTLLSR